MLYKQKVYKQGNVYIDLYCIWEHDGHCYKVRVEPRFKSDKVLLLSQAKELDPIVVED